MKPFSEIRLLPLVMLTVGSRGRAGSAPAGSAELARRSGRCARCRDPATPLLALDEVGRHRQVAATRN